MLSFGNGGLLIRWETNAFALTSAAPDSPRQTLPASSSLMHPIASHPPTRSSRHCLLALLVLGSLQPLAEAQTQPNQWTGATGGRAQLQGQGQSTPTQAQGANAWGGAPSESGSGPVQLQNQLTGPGQPLRNTLSMSSGLSVPYQPGEFELYIQNRLASAAVRRLGAQLMQPDSASVDSLPQVPSDYLLLPGDELQVAIWGSVEANLQLVVDRSGRITLPRVGTITVAGVRFSDIPALLKQQVAKQFRNFDLSVSVGQLRGIRVYVTGFVGRPGAYSVSSLSTLSSALIAAGGPTSAGSFRNIQLRRGGKLLSQFDLYDLLVSGDRSADRVLQPDDVIHVAPVGPQVAVLGSVNQPAIVELKAGDTLGSALRLVGGLSSVADTGRVSVETLSDRTSTRVAQVSWPEGGSRPLQGGDVVNVFSVVDTKIPMGKQNKRVVVEGEVQRPGVYVLPAQSSLRDAIAAAGGLTNDAFVFGTQFTRESVRITQQENYDRALRDLEVDLTRNSSTQRAGTSDEVKAQEGRADATQQLVSKLRLVRPTGRVVINLAPSETNLPLMTLEDGDRLYIPSPPTSVGVFGSVFNTGSFVYNAGRTIGSYLADAGGTTRGADKDSVFLIRANGSVVSNLQSSGWLSDGKLASLAALPGDTVFVPEELNKTTFVQNAKDWTQILYQFALGAAAVNTIK